MHQRLRLRSILLLILSVLVVAAAAAYFLGIDPIYRRIPLGLDLQGGVHVVYQGVDTPENPVTDTSMEDARRIIEQRVDALGVAEPVIQRQGKDRIIVELAGVKDPAAALEAIGRTALLEFKDPEGKVIVTGADLEEAREQINPTTGQAEVALRFNAEGARKFGEATARLVGQTIAIVLDGETIQNPQVREAIPGGQAVITGYPDLAAARGIAIGLQSGALPVKLEIIENRTVSASLGSDSVAKSLQASIVGIAAVLAFMLLSYRIPGFWADIALAVYLLLFLGVLYGLRATLTLPGIAGLVLSVGMAVDANVVIFERIRDELRLGLGLRAAVEEGFKNGYRAVFDSNVTTLIAAAILFWLGTGPIRGFALILAIGVVISMFTAITLTRFLLRNLVDAGARPGPFLFTGKGVQG